MNGDFWQFVHNGVTQTAAQWGSNNVRRKRKSAQTGTVTFEMPSLALDGVQPFNFLDPVTILRNGAQWFVGWVTQIPRVGTTKKEAITYELSDAWYWLEHTVFQQQWNTITATGAGVVTSTTTQSEVILGQSLDGVSMTSGQVMMEVLLYAQYAYQMIPFPSVVTTANLPPAPAVAAPFQIGQLTPSITIPYFQVRDKSCADILRQMMKYSPSAVAWVDNSTTPPTLNIAQRASPGAMAMKTIRALTSSIPGCGYAVSGCNAKPRYDVQVPVVVVKFQETTTINGSSDMDITVQSWPAAPPGVNAEAWLSQPRAWVQTIDLVGAHTTSQSADIKVIERPTTIQDESAMSWALYKEAWLQSTTQAIGPTTYVYDWGNISMAYLNTVIDPHDPLNDPDNNPNAITLPGCPQLIAELLTGAFPDWLQEAPNALDAAKVQIEVWYKYAGTDPATQALFWYDPGCPLAPRRDGSGYMVRYYNCKVTNADTKVYTQQTSGSAGAPVPGNFASYLYNEMAQLHFDGTLTIVEQECSDLLPIGCLFNAMDGLAAWQAMDALVLSSAEDLDTGTTSVQFGPPLFLGLDELAELFRAGLGILPAWKTNQRLTGQQSGGSNVIGDKHAADTNTVPPSPPPPLNTFPFQVLWRRNPADPSGNTFQAMVQLNSNLWTTLNTTTPITGLDTWFNLNPNDTIWLLASVANLAVTPGTPTIHSYGMGNNDYNAGAAIWSAGSALENDGTAPPNGPNQTLFRKVIAISTADAKGRPKIQQQFSGDLLMTLSQVNGIPCLIPT